MSLLLASSTLQQMHPFDIRFNQPPAKRLSAPNKAPRVTVLREKRKPENIKQIVHRLPNQRAPRNPTPPAPPCHYIDPAWTNSRFQHLPTKPR
ncbi:hypothetical protein HanXRQr2_Chr09g0409541 [Helianthus annuus]|uniref:Uncharacterized protein n=1 Tax=Helianthus annuus TaxID=4232 RepID=A0A9K3I9Q4_HELAN|nr:hypothetical protein HanXRQr2_Chr09g0409541 [Helianthus annuus]